MAAMVDLLPPGAQWAAFAISRMEMPFVAQSVLLGGNVRVGLEDNLYLRRGVFASNAQLVEQAVAIVEALGARPLTACRGARQAGSGSGGCVTPPQPVSRPAPGLCGGVASSACPRGGRPSPGAPPRSRPVRGPRRLTRGVAGRGQALDSRRAATTCDSKDGVRCS